MTQKPEQNNQKATEQKPVRKILKGASETSRLFVHVDDILRRTQALRLTRYVE